MRRQVMYSKTTHWFSLLLAVLLLAGVAATPRAQEPLPELPEGTEEFTADVSDLVGVIPGTNMLRDEFRARALIQLKALALNALTYRMLNKDEYAQSFYVLKQSSEWNLDLTNMFSGRSVQAIYFEPQPGDMTMSPVLDLPLLIEDLPPLPGGFGGGGIGEQNGGEGVDAGGGASLQPMTPVGRARVDPTRIRRFTGGDVFYYADEELLQLVMFAPDGSYIEYVDETPNMRWQDRLETPASGMWPDSVYAAQLLYFSSDLLPQHHNLVQFMGDREWLSMAEFARVGAAERIGMAEALNITMLNPFTRERITSGAEFSLGDFVEADQEAPLPLRMWLRDGGAWTLADLHGAEPAADEGPAAAPGGEEEAPPAPKRPPLGGRK